MRRTFTWRGQAIDDIRGWARARGEQLVHYHAHRTMPTVIGGRAQMVSEESTGFMPESFWNGLRQDHGWQYDETRRETP